MSFSFGSGSTPAFGSYNRGLATQSNAAQPSFGVSGVGSGDPTSVGSVGGNAPRPGAGSALAAQGFAGTPNPPMDASRLPEALELCYYALDPTSPDYPFAFYSYNRREDADAPQPGAETVQAPPCPPRPLAQLWIEAVESNPDPKKYAVVRIAGFPGLQERAALQTRRLEELRRATEDIEQRISRLRVTFEQHIVNRLERIRAQHSLLETKFLTVVALLECTLVSRTAVETATGAVPPSAAGRSALVLKRDSVAESRLRARLDAVRKQLDGANGMRARALRALEATATVLGLDISSSPESIPAASASGKSGGQSSTIGRIRPADTVSERHLLEILERERQGMEHVFEVLEHDRRETETLWRAARELIGPTR
jgi:hypothetical protein